jgi:hypothetical protein
MGLLGQHWHMRSLENLSDHFCIFDVLVCVILGPRLLSEYSLERRKMSFQSKSSRQLDCIFCCKRPFQLSIHVPRRSDV